jgi:hypothetical protein
MTRQHSPRRRPRKPVGRRETRRIIASEARRRAIRHVVRQMLAGTRVVDGKHADMGVYALPREDVWVVFKQARGVPALRAAEIIAVCQRTGKMLYEGPTSDEG